MPVDPFLVPILVDYPQVPEHIEDYPAFRAQEKAQTDGLVAQLAEPGPEVRERRRVTIPVDGGSIDLLIYQPDGPGPHPVHLYLHGGAWVVGSIDHSHIDITCRERCVGARCVVVSVDYRKAPEHKYPTALQDCAAALRWVVEHADELGARTDLVTVGGGSAGGNLAAALCLKTRDEAGPAIAFQLLEVPALDLTMTLSSHTEYGTGYALARRDMELAREAYLPSLNQATDPYASPLHAPDLSGLPPAHIMAAEYDALRDDAVEYARRLTEAGVPVTHSLQSGHVHVSSVLTAAMESARAWREEALTVLRRVHAQVTA
jgi:acetyl esterase